MKRGLERTYRRVGLNTLIDAAPLTQQAFKDTMGEIMAVHRDNPYQVLGSRRSSDSPALPCSPASGIESRDTTEDLLDEDIDANDIDLNDASYSTHRLAYKKILGHELDPDDVEKLQSIGKQSTADSLLQIGGDLIAKQEKNENEAALMNLSISKIFDLLKSDMTEAYTKGFYTDQWIEIISETKTMKLDDIAGMENSTGEIFDKIIETAQNTKDLLRLIHEKQWKLLSEKNERNEKYLMLSMLEMVARNFGRWGNPKDISEITYYRRFASVLDLLFDETDIIMSDGEHVSAATKDGIDMNKALFNHSDTSYTYGRKIDLILSYDGKEEIQISMNEWKRSSVQTDLKIKQRAKESEMQRRHTRAHQKKILQIGRQNSGNGLRR
ncbi:hypothetical protein BX666DRAFT_1896008 [Dichotomocladium elegans]|nr:hypothetical protein BX666DRAFT_1896008 [Dichotomocladium elegans]